MTKWIDGEGIIFVQGEDPGVGQIRVVANYGKVIKNENERGISFIETAEVIFGKSRSVLIEEYTQTTTKGGKEVNERQFKIAGLTNCGRPLLVVLNPREDGGTAKRVVTAWELSRNSKEVKKLLDDFPMLKSEIETYKETKK